MNRIQAVKFLPLIQAYAEGKIIQRQSEVHDEWMDLCDPSWSGNVETYRIKPEPREFWLVNNKRGATIGVYSSRTTAITLADVGDTIIHVREVIE